METKLNMVELFNKMNSYEKEIILDALFWSLLRDDTWTKTKKELSNKDKLIKFEIIEK